MSPSRLTTNDLIQLPYSADLTQAGIAYACRSLPYTYDRMGGSPYERLRRIVVGVAVELAFRRLLVERGIPHDTRGSTPFTDPDRYDVALGGRRCDLKSFLIFNKEDIRKLRREPAALLEAAALVPTDQVRTEGRRAEDLYVFAFVNALVTRQRQDLARALAAGQPTYLIHTLPSTWARPRIWASLRPLAVKSAGPDPIRLELGGQVADHEFQSEQLSLLPLTPTHAQADFHTLVYLHAGQLPSSQVGLHSPRRGPAYLVQTGEWGNIWVYGLEIVLAGYLPVNEFRRRGQLLPVGSRVLQYRRTRTENLAVPVAGLRPLSDLFQRVQQWEHRREAKTLDGR